MPNRFLKESITTSATLARLSAAEERFFLRLTVVVDDFGRVDARPCILRAKCFAAMLDEVKDTHIVTWLAGLERVGLVQLYTIEGNPYCQIATWDRHQVTRAKRSKCPPPPEADHIREQPHASANICEQTLANVSVFGSGSGSEYRVTGNGSGSESTCVEPRSLTLAHPSSRRVRGAYSADFEAFWAVYPARRRQKKADAWTEWQKLKPDQALQERIRDALAWQVAQADWLEDSGRWIPHACRYLSKRRWEDERPPRQGAFTSPRTAGNAAALAGALASLGEKGTT